MEDSTKTVEGLPGDPFREMPTRVSRARDAPSTDSAAPSSVEAQLWMVVSDMINVAASLISMPAL